MTRSGDVGGRGEATPATAAAGTTTSTNKATDAKSPSRTRTTSTPAGAQSDDEVTMPRCMLISFCSSRVYERHG